MKYSFTEPIIEDSPFTDSEAGYSAFEFLHGY